MNAEDNQYTSAFDAMMDVVTLGEYGCDQALDQIKYHHPDIYRDMRYRAANELMEQQAYAACPNDWQVIWFDEIEAWLHDEQDEYISEIFAAEPHGAWNHPIAKDPHGTLRWVPDPVINMLFDMNVEPSGPRVLDLNNLFFAGANKNDPVVRKFYKMMGYSLYGYWEVMIWDVNNPQTHEYQEPQGEV